MASSNTASGAPSRRGVRSGDAHDLRTSSLALRCAIESLLNAPPVSLQIQFENDKVVLRGTVSSAIERRTIEMAARELGIRKVESHLSVRAVA